MSFHSTLHVHRQKPEHHRRRLSFALSAVATLFIFAVWAVTLPAKMASLTPAQPAAVTASSPVDALRKNINSSLETFKANINTEVSSVNQLQAGPTQAGQAYDTSYGSGVVITDSSTSQASSSSRY